MLLDTGDHPSAIAQMRTRLMRTVNEHVSVSDRAIINAGYARTAREHVPVSDSSTARVLMTVSGDRVIATASGPTLTVTRHSEVSTPGVRVD